jgi:tetratricopeptide (TPR) repeat protein
MWEILLALDLAEWIALGGLGVAAIAVRAAVTSNRLTRRPQKAEAAAQQIPEPQPEEAPNIPLIGLPAKRNIIGRAQDLADLHTKLSSNQDVAITNSGAILAGQGGIGKTTLARAYADQYKQHYDGVLWVEATSRTDTARGISALYQHHGNETRPETPSPEDAAAYIAALTGRWLFIYDNVETRDDIRRMLPENHALIVTTRQGEGWDDGFAVQRADVLPPDEAVALLAREAQREADALAATLGHLPLALVIAGGLIRKEGLSFAQAETQLERIIARAPKQSDYPDSVIGAVKLSYDELSDDAKLVADLFAWWAPEGLYAQLITGAPDGPNQDMYEQHDNEAVDSLARDPARVAESIEALEDRSLLTRAETGHAMHRMTAAALRAMQTDETYNAAAAALLATVYPAGENGPMNSGSWPLCRRLTPHLRSLESSGQMPEIAAMDFLLNQASIFTEKTGDTEGAVRFARAALKLTQKRLPESDRGIAVRHANLAMALLRARDLDAAESEFRRAVALAKEHKHDQMDLAQYHDLLGVLLVDQGRAGDRAKLTEALREHQRSAAILRRHVPRLSDVRAQVLNNLGAVRESLGQSAAALRLYDHSLAIRRAVLPEGDARLGYALNNVGAMALKSGAADRAEPLLEEALALRQAVYLEAPRHPEIVGAADWLVSCYLTRARVGENAGLRQAKAKRLCEEFGFDFAERVADAKRFPYTPQKT